jgi:hypothetical protein
MTSVPLEAIRDAVRTSRAAQGFGPHVEDLVVLAMVVRALETAPVEERRAS